MTQPSLFNRLKAGLEEGISHELGELKLQAQTLEVPQPPKDYGPAEVKALRVKLRLSQAQLASFLYVSKKTVQGWEQGLRRPTSSSARLLQIIEKPELLDSLTK